MGGVGRLGVIEVEGAVPGSDEEFCRVLGVEADRGDGVGGRWCEFVLGVGGHC